MSAHEEPGESPAMERGQPAPLPEPAPAGDPLASRPVQIPPGVRALPPEGQKIGVSPLERKLLTRTQAELSQETITLRREVEGLRRLLDISRELSSILDHDRLLEVILDSAIVLTAAQRGFFLVQEGKRFRVLLGRSNRQDKLEPQDTQISETLARQCLEEDRVLPYDNISELPELSKVRSIRKLDLYAAVCVPLRERGIPIGALYLDSSTPGLRSSGREIPLLEAFAAQASVSLMNARLLRNLEESRVLLTRENLDLRAEARASAGFANIIGRSRPMVALFDKMKLIKDSGISVLVTGESGTGKELVARALHYEGLNQDAAFVPLNCAGIPDQMLESLMFGHKRGAFTGAYYDNPGLVEQAEGGTLFLDEIGDMAMPLQAKLLRFLADGEFRRVGETEVRRVKTRVISATNQDLQTMILDRTFREDLFFRIAGIRLEIPPLRERKDDLPLLIEHFFERVRGQRQISGITERASSYLLRHPWPGNVRQLEYAIMGACAMVPEGQPLDEPHLRMQMSEPAIGDADPSQPLQRTLIRTERQMILDALQESDWNVTRAAQLLGITRQHLHKRIAAYKLKRPPEPPIR